MRRVVRESSCALLGLLAILLAMPEARPATAAAKDKEARFGDYRISGPYTYSNLTIFLIHGKDRDDAKSYLTLQEALKKNKAVVHETGSVNELTVENTSKDTEVFVQSGDIVKGGKQDRLISFDLILPPQSGKVAVTTFCVEHDRWQKRGQEAVDQFHASSAQLPNKTLKLVGGSYSQVGGMGAQGGGLGALGGGLGALGGGLGALGAMGGQGGVWSEVAVVQKKLRKNAGAKDDAGSSLQLTLEDKKVQAAIGAYVKELELATERQKDVLGFAFAINGKINSAEMYTSSEMFKKLWPKLLNAAAAEALAEFEKGKAVQNPTADDLKSCLLDAAKGETKEQDVSDRTRVILHETKKNILLETRDREQKKGWIHLTYITK
jgi:hypothetical protein